MNTKQLLAEKGQLWMAKVDYPAFFPTSPAVILKSRPASVLVKFLSGVVPIWIDRTLLIKKVEPGDGVSHHLGSDIYPYTIVSISKNNKRINVRADGYIRLDKNGASETQLYAYSPDPQAYIISILLRKDGTFKNSDKEGYFTVGKREHYHDFSF